MNCKYDLGDPTTTTCGDFSGCYTGSPLGNSCLTNVALEQYSNEKHYWLSRAYGYNRLNGSGCNFSGFKVIFSPTDLTSGNPDKEYLLGSTAGSVVTDDISFDKEVVGFYIL